MYKCPITLLLILTIVLSACTSLKNVPPNADPRLQALQRKSDTITRDASRCTEQATQQTSAQVKRVIAAGNNPGSAAVQMVLDQGDGAVAKCREDEAAAQAQVAAQERAAFIREAQAERDRAALMATLTSSLGH